MNDSLNTIRKFLRIPLRDKFLLLESFFYLTIARAALLLPFNRVSPYLGKQFSPNQIPAIVGESTIQAYKIGWSVEVMSYRTPWESACLAQAIAAKLMLKRRGIKSLMYLGMKKDERGNFMAHAWLQSGSEIILGGANAETFSILSAIGDVPEQVENV